jgi:Family of unknown function (DUF6689)
MRSILITAPLLVLCVARSAAPQTVPVPLTIVGNQASATIALPGGIGAELTLTFENSVGLNPSALEAWVSLVNPLDPALLSRLPAQVQVPVLFPVLLRIGPSASSALSFSGVWTLVLHTHNLTLDPGLPLSLYSAEDDGVFRDIMGWEGTGSYRAGGSGGNFSEFLIVLDLQAIDLVITQKFAALQALLNEHTDTMPPVVAATLQSRLTQARTSYLLGDISGAIAKMASFASYTLAHSGQDIPDVWRANDPELINVAGLLRSGAGTLIFSLTRKGNL